MEYIQREIPEKYRYVSQSKVRRDMMISHTHSCEEISAYFTVNHPKIMDIVNREKFEKIEDFSQEIPIIYRSNQQ
jgi:hypothetical protein